jgi:hypothetical protein
MVSSSVLDIQFAKASKFYEPLETVSGTVAVTTAKTYTDHGEFSITAEAYMDTVSAIRGNLGKGPMRPTDRFVFMCKNIIVSHSGKTIAHEPLKFSFTLDKTGQHALIDAYVGIEFSIVYKVTAKVMIYGKEQKGTAEFYCNVPGSGMDSALGKRLVP